ncbi:MAG: hypothetical protein H8E57_05275, partial [Candidatus Cloacimonetes bacterium]|nr:hypothetical protein [Candidatus Cloacimonadota bacterium]
MGKQIAVDLLPLTDKSEIEYRLKLTSEIQELLKNKIFFNFEDISDINELISKNNNQTYNFKEFRKIHFNVSAANLIHNSLQEFEDFPLFLELSSTISPLQEIEERYNQIFFPDGEIKDSASSALRSIRAKQRNTRKKIVSTLNIKMEKFAENNHLFDKVVTQRDGRFVVPIKMSSISSVDGVVHGRSSSKASVYMEPKEVVGLNNETRILENEEKQEIYRIFTSFTEDISKNNIEILQNTEILKIADFYFASARLANSYQAEVPVITEEKFIHLINARHPLLIKSLGSVNEVIPFNLELGKDCRLLLISGPNTGGKTVTLKSVGLLTLMALTGLPIPASFASKIGIFTDVFADIGDNQSLENALSTFSSHIKNINEMIDNGNESSLILIDEIGAATDPEQGSALAQAILEKLTEKKVIGVITTHYTSLKVFAEKNDNCVNAAMQFDPDNHIPTYSFKLGLPGNSFAIEVASQLGLNNNLIQRAKELAGSQNVELTELIKKMATEKKELVYQSYQYRLKTALFKQRIKEYESKIEQQEEDAKKIKKKSVKQARDFLTTMQKELNKEISDIKKSGKANKQQLLKKTYQKISQKNASFKEKEEELLGIEREQIQDVFVGQLVWMKDFDSEGEVVEISANSVKVDVNGITFSTTAENLFQTENRQKKNFSKKIVLPKIKAKLELKIMGYRFDEAQPEIEKFLDRAILNGLKTVRIV